MNFRQENNERETYLEFKNESQDVEFKSIWKDEYLNCICSFANAQGGRLFIGVDDVGKVVGLKDSQELLEILPSKIRDSLGIVVDINLLNGNNKNYIEIKVPAYPIAVSCKDNPTYTYAELALLLGVNKKTIVSHFKNLKNKKIVRRIGTSKKGYWIIEK